MDVCPGHREKDITDFTRTYSLVARQMSMAEVDRIPVAKAAMDAEWSKLKNMKRWDTSTVAEFDVVKEAKIPTSQCTSGVFSDCQREEPRARP